MALECQLLWQKTRSLVEGYVRAKEVSCCFVLTLPSGQPGCPKGEAAREKDEEGCDYTYGRCWRRVGGRRSGDHEITGPGVE